MIGVDVVFLAAGLIILLGFFSMRFFEKTKIPDILILMFIGVFITQGLNVVDPGVFIFFAPYVGALALMMILFEGGINLKFARVLRELPKATGFTIAVFSLTCVLLALTMSYLFKWGIMEGLLLGAVVGGTSSAIVISLVSKLDMDDCFRIILTLESTLTDALCIIVAITLAGVIVSGSADLSSIANSLFSAFSIAGVAAFLFGIFWIKILARFRKMPFGYLLTVAMIFLLYAVVEFSKGNGAIAAFIFGLVLGNSTEIASFLKIDGKFTLDESIKTFHEEVSFFIRTFFFVYLGLIFDPATLTLPMIGTSLIVLIVLIAARFIPTYFMLRHTNGNAGTLIATMMPRGLAAAVLATYPMINDIPSIPAGFKDIVILIIILTNVIATVGAFIYERRRKTGSGQVCSGDYAQLCDSRPPVAENPKT